MIRKCYSGRRVEVIDGTMDCQASSAHCGTKPYKLPLNALEGNLEMFWHPAYMPTSVEGLLLIVNIERTTRQI